VNIDRRANTSAASIPIAMVDARNEGKLKKGNIVVLAALALDSHGEELHLDIKH